MRRLIADYPRLLLFTCAIVIAYLLYRQGAFAWIETHLDGFSYPSLLLGGALYGFGFTSPLATAYLIAIAGDVSPIPAALIAGIGAGTADFGIAKFVALSFHEEILRFRATRFYERIRALFHHETVPERLRRWWHWLLAAFLIASPLPDEIGITIIAGVTDIDSRKIAVLGYVLNTLGILVILLLAR